MHLKTCMRYHQRSWGRDHIAMACLSCAISPAFNPASCNSSHCAYWKVCDPEYPFSSSLLWTPSVKRCATQKLARVMSGPGMQSPWISMLVVPLHAGAAGAGAWGTIVGACASKLIGSGVVGTGRSSCTNSGGMLKLMTEVGDVLAFLAWSRRLSNRLSCPSWLAGRLLNNWWFGGAVRDANSLPLSWWFTSKD